MPKKHHFLLLRHCVRSTPRGIDFGMGDETYSWRLDDYIDEPLPNWNTGEMDCIPDANGLVEKSGKWLIESGAIQPGSKIKWEIVADTVHRDVDTAFFLSSGIYEGLQSTYDMEQVETVGERDIHANADFSDPTFCVPDIPDKDITNEVKNRLNEMPRPTLDFQDALQLAQYLAGQGKAGNLKNTLTIHPELNEDSWLVQGAASFLNAFGATLFYARAGNVQPEFVADASKEQVFQLLQFTHWHRSVMEVGNSWSAVYGAMQAQALVQVLRLGYYQRPLSQNPPISQDPSNTADDGDDEYDTSVTIVLGHDGDLDCIATALGVQWILKKPYISGPGGAFLPTPPMSGIHAVRDTTTDRIDLSFVYPMYSSDDSDKSPNFHHNKTGILESTPLLFQQGLPFSSVDGTSTQLNAPKNHHKSSVDVLEDHILQVLSGYNQQATDCYHEAVDHWSTLTKPNHDPVSVLTSAPVRVEQNSLPASSPPLLVSLMVFGSGIIFGLFFMYMWSQRKYRTRSLVAESEDNPMKHKGSSTVCDNDDNYCGDDDEEADSSNIEVV